MNTNNSSALTRITYPSPGETGDAIALNAIAATLDSSTRPFRTSRPSAPQLAHGLHGRFPDQT